MKLGRVIDRPDRAVRRARCSFCGKGSEEVARLIAGPRVRICDECVALCNRILDEEAARTP